MVFLRCSCSYSSISQSVTPRPWRRANSHPPNDRADSPDGPPISVPATLRSSSKSGQCTPTPPPRSSQLLRSWGVPSHNRGNQDKGDTMGLIYLG